MKLNWISIGATLGALAVVLGAFGAHSLRDRVTSEALEIWKTGVLYHALHALALVLHGLFTGAGKGRFVGACFFLGTLIFSGTLYGLALGAPTWLGAITPIGGLFLIVGWIGFAVAAARKSTDG